MDDKVINYFSRKAKNYNKRRQKGILGWWVGREKRIILELLNPIKGEMILDAGCGAGYYSLLIKNIGATPYGIDNSPKMIGEVRKPGIEAGIIDLEKFNLKIKFDKIICAGAIEFCKNIDDVILNLKAHLKEKGFLISSFPRKSLLGFAFFYFIYHTGLRLNYLVKKS